MSLDSCYKSEEKAADEENSYAMPEVGDPRVNLMKIYKVNQLVERRLTQKRN